MEIDGDGTVLACRFDGLSHVSPSVQRPLARMRHGEGNVWKDQAYGKRLRVSPRNSVECAEATLIRPVACLEQLSYYPQLQARVVALYAQGQDRVTIAQTLNAEGWRPAKRRTTFTPPMVGRLLARQGLHYLTPVRAQPRGLPGRGVDLTSARAGPRNARRDPLWLGTPWARDRPAGHQCGAAPLAHSGRCCGTRPSAGTPACATALAAASGGPTIRTRLLRRLYGW